jgi:hypothetical protein
MEHWDVILDFAERLDAEKAQTLRRYSYPREGRILPPLEEVGAMLAFIRHLQDEILEAPPLVPEASDLFPENFPNDEHVRMLEAVVAVLLEAQRLGQPFEGDTN